MRAHIGRAASALVITIAAGCPGGGEPDGLVLEVGFSGQGTVQIVNAPGEKPLRVDCAWDDDEPCVVSSGAPVVVTAQPAPGWRFAGWEDAASRSEEEQPGYARCEGSAPSFTMAASEADFPYRRYCEAVFLEESTDAWPVEITWDAGGRVDVAGDAAPTSAEGMRWTGTVPDRGRLELSAVVLDPEQGDVVFLGWREDARCPVADPTAPEAVIPSVTGPVVCHAELGPADNPCGDVDPGAVQASFTVNGVAWDALPAQGDPPVHEPGDPGDIRLEAMVSGVAPDLVVYRWAVKPYHSEEDPPWIDLQACDLTEATCAWDATGLMRDGSVVAAALLRLTVAGCAGAVDITVGPAQDGAGNPAYLDLFP